MTFWSNSLLPEISKCDLSYHFAHRRWSGLVKIQILNVLNIRQVLHSILRKSSDLRFQVIQLYVIKAFYSILVNIIKCSSMPKAKVFDMLLCWSVVGFAVLASAILLKLGTDSWCVSKRCQLCTEASCTTCFFFHKGFVYPRVVGGKHLFIVVRLLDLRDP